MNKFLSAIALVVFVLVLSACGPKKVIEDDLDTEAPVIVLSGGTTSLTMGDTFVEPTCSVTDNVDSDLTCTISGEVNENVAGVYTLTYSVMDSEGNEAVERTFIVTVAEVVLETYFDVLKYIGEYDSTTDQAEIIQFINMINDNEFVKYYLTVAGEESYSEDYVLTDDELEEFNLLFDSYAEVLFDNMGFVLQDFFYEEGDYVYLDSTKEVLMSYIGNDTDVTIPNGVKTIGYGAFYDKELTNVTLPSSVLMLSIASFNGNNFMSITIPEGVESIGLEAFADNPIEEVVIEGLSTRFDEMWLLIGFPKDLATFITTTEDGLEFNKATGEIIGYSGSLPTLVIPSVIEGVSVTSIDEGVFVFGGLSEITIPESIIRIDEGAFYGNSLTSITILGDDTRFDGVWLDVGFPRELATFIIVTEDGIEFNTSSGEIIGYTGTSTTVVIPSIIEGIDVTEIGQQAFSYEGLTEITIPISVTKIDFEAFYGNPLTSITILGDETRFDDMWQDIGFPIELAEFIVTTDEGIQFDKNNGQIIAYFGTATTLVIPSEIDGIEVTEIIYFAFEYRGISELTIPETVTWIGYGAFMGNPLTSLVILGDDSRFNDEWLDIGFPIEFADFIVTTADGLQFDKTSGAIIGYTGSLTTLVIPSEIEGVAVTEIGSYVFEGNRSITSVTIPDSVLIIGQRAFASSKGVLATLVLGNGVQEIGYEAFKGHGIANIVIPESVEIIDYDAFYPTNELVDPIQSILIEGVASRFDDTWEDIGFPLEFASFVVTTEEGIQFNKNEGMIIGYEGTLTTLVLPSTIDGVAVTTIKYSAFEFSNLTDITIPESITTIYYGAFYSNPLENITIMGDDSRFDDVWLEIGFPAELSSFIVLTDDDLLFNKNTGTIIGYSGTETILVLPSEIEGVAVTRIIYRTFEYSNITEITIPESIVFIEYGAFFGNPFTSITILGDAERFDDIWEDIGFPLELAEFIVITEDGFVFNSNTGSIYEYTGTLTVLVIPSTIEGVDVVTIESWVFNYRGLTDVTIPETVTWIQYGAFGENPLETITILGDASRFNDTWLEIGFPLELGDIDYVSVLIGGMANDSIGVPGESDYYLFEVFETTTIIIYSESTSDTVATLYNENSEYIYYDDDSGNGNNFQIELELTPGVYYVIVKAFSNTSVFDYTLYIDSNPS